MNVFISYSHHDKNFAKDIAERLEKRRITYFFAEKLDAGEVFEDKIRNSLRLCKEVFVLISPNAIKSKWIYVECGAAWALGKHISPIRLVRSPGTLPDIFRSRQCKDFEQIDEVIDACRNRLSTEPDLKGEWHYDFYRPIGRLKYTGICTITQGPEWLHFDGTREFEILDPGQREEVTKGWYSGWAAICADGRVRAEYKFGNADNGFMSLHIPPDRPVHEMSGEVHLVTTHESGYIKFIRIISNHSD
jgi:hypothetical protein